MYKNSVITKEVTAKYFYLSSIATIFLFFSVNHLNLCYNTSNYLALTYFTIKYLNQKYFIQITLVGLVSYLFTLFFKLAIFPWQHWVSDIYGNLPYSVLAIFIIPLKVLFYFLLWIALCYIFAPLKFIFIKWIWVAAIFSMIWGCFTAVFEKHFKKFISYTSVNQVGFLLIGFILFNFFSFIAIINYIIIYSITNLGFFTIIIKSLSNSKNRLFYYINEYNSEYFRTKNNYYIILLIFFSFMGIPPLAGFFGKFYVILSIFYFNFLFLLVIIFLTTIISSFYYLSILTTIFFQKNSKIEYFFSKKLVIQFILVFFTTFLSMYIIIQYIYIIILQKITWNYY